MRLRNDLGLSLQLLADSFEMLLGISFDELAFACAELHSLVSRIVPPSFWLCPATNVISNCSLLFTPNSVAVFTPSSLSVALVLGY
jgi:hypothetical protein